MKTPLGSFFIALQCHLSNTVEILYSYTGFGGRQPAQMIIYTLHLVVSYWTLNHQLLKLSCEHRFASPKVHTWQKYILSLLSGLLEPFDQQAKPDILKVYRLHAQMPSPDPGLRTVDDVSWRWRWQWNGAPPYTSSPLDPQHSNSSLWLSIRRAQT